MFSLQTRAAVIAFAMVAPFAAPNFALAQGPGGPPAGGPPAGHEQPGAPSFFSSTILPTDATHVNRPWQVTQSPPAIVTVQPGVCRFALKSCQIVQDSKNRFAFRCLAGSLYSMEAERHLKLVRGRVLARANSDPFRIETAVASVMVQPGSGVIVETASNGLTRIYCVSAASNNPAAQVTTSGGQAPVPLMPGQELVVATHNLSSEELQPLDGIERKDISGSLTTLGSQARLSEFSLAQMVQYDSLIGCINVGRSRGLDVLVDQVNRLAHSQQDFSKTLKSPPCNPSTAGNSSALRITYETLKDENDMLALATTGATVSVEGHDIHLDKGALLVTSKQPVRIQATGREISISRGAVALVDADHATLRVANISEASKDTLRVAYGNQSVSLIPGKQILFTADPPHLSDVYSSGKIGQRDIAARESGDYWITTSEISLVDAVVHDPLVSALRKTGTSTVERQLITRLTKEAAIISIVHQGAPFERIESDQAIAAGSSSVRCNACLE